MANTRQAVSIRPAANTPNTYPSSYPNTLPGGIPMPQINLPGKKPKDKGAKGDEVQTTMASVDGTLRKLGEKDLLLQTAKRVVLRFRLLSKTKFLNKAGEPMRDSLLHPGDQLSIQVSPDDEETALRVTLLRAGTANDRYTAELPVEDGTIRAPRPEDLSKPRTVTTHETAAPAEPAPEGDEPKLKRQSETAAGDAHAVLRRCRTRARDRPRRSAPQHR